MDEKDNRKKIETNVCNHDLKSENHTLFFENGCYMCAVCEKEVNPS